MKTINSLDGGEGDIEYQPENPTPGGGGSRSGDDDDPIRRQQQKTQGDVRQTLDHNDNSWALDKYGSNIFSINPGVKLDHSIAHQKLLLKQMIYGLDGLANILLDLRSNFKRDLETDLKFTTVETAAKLTKIYNEIEGSSSNLARKIASIDVPRSVDLLKKL